MLLRKHLMPIMGLLGTMVTSASAQYVYHHQQLFIDAVRGNETDIKARALEPVNEINEKSWLWTANWQPSIFTTASPLRPLLVKMDPNQPESSPFNIQWAMTYLFPGEEQGDPQPFALEVQDVHSIPGTFEYLLCGMFRKGDNVEGAFLLKTDWYGQPIMFKYYPEIYILHSVVSKVNVDKGYVAVGHTRFSQTDPRAAVFLSVDAYLDPTCVQTVKGDWREDGDVEAFYKKVIPIDKNQRFAAVGATKLEPYADQSLVTQDMLLSVFDDECNASCNNHFGAQSRKVTNQKGFTVYHQFFEDGESVAELGNFRGLAITGTTRRLRISNQNTKKLYMDIVLFMITNECKLKYAKRYDIDRSDDFGLAIQIRKKDQRNTIVIAGQSNNQFLSDSTDSRVKTNDVVLLTTRVFNGRLLSTELFGGSGSEGKNRMGWMDLHLSHESSERYPIVLANTRDTWPSAGIHNPYLIERYDFREEECHDIALDRKERVYKAKRLPASSKTIDVQSPRLDIEGFEVGIEQEILCKKQAV